MEIIKKILKVITAVCNILPTCDASTWDLTWHTLEWCMRHGQYRQFWTYKYTNSHTHKCTQLVLRHKSFRIYLPFGFNTDPGFWSMSKAKLTDRVDKCSMTSLLFWWLLAVRMDWLTDLSGNNKHHYRTTTFVGLQHKNSSMRANSVNLTGPHHDLNLSLVFPTKHVLNQSPQLQTLARDFICSKITYDTFQTANNKGADQTVQIRRLVCTCVVRKASKTGFLHWCPNMTIPLSAHVCLISFNCLLLFY